MKMWVPDVSEHQGKIDWQSLVGKIPAAVIRVGYGNDEKSQDDVYALYNMQECSQKGIPFFVYLYSHAKNDSMIKSEIAHTKRMCKGFDPLGYWLDLEERSCEGYWKQAAKAWHDVFGDKAGVYSWQWAFEKYVKVGRRWIAAFGKNNGKPDKSKKPTIDCDAWQFTSKARLSGIHGYVDMSEWYAPIGDAKPIEIVTLRREVLKKEVAAMIMRHLCTHNKHGYTQDMSGRQGTGTETIDIYGVKYIIKGGDRDCSSAVISAYESAGISCGGASYTGNMSRCMTETGNFVRRTMKFTAQMGDCYLNDACHTAMCLSAEPDVLMEFSINEKGKVLGGKVGDQKQSGEYDMTYGRGESHLRMYYNYPWSCILQCVNDEVAFYVEPDGSITYPKKEQKKVEIIQSDKTDTDLAVEVLFGVYGSNEARRKALGGRYDPVQKEVTALWNSPALRTDAEKSYFKKFGCTKLI